MSALKWVTVSVTLLFAGWACSAQESTSDREWVTSTSCKYPKHENWTDLCLSISGPITESRVYKNGERIDLTLSVKNEGDALAEGITAQFYVDAIGEESTIAFGDIEPGKEVRVSFSQNAKMQRTKTKMLWLTKKKRCDERALITFPPVEVPRRIGPCEKAFEEVVQDE